MMTLTLNATVLQLPTDLVWDDEFLWTPIQQSTDYTLTGGLIIDSDVKQAGQPIVLRGDVNAGVIERGILKELYAMLSDNAEMELLIDQGTFNVRFDHSAKPIKATPLIDAPDLLDSDFYQLVIKFIKV